MAGSFSLEDLTDEQRQKLLEDFAPGPLSTGPMARGAQGFAPLPLPSTPAAFESEGSTARSGIDPDLFARFAAAQQRGAKLDTLNALGHGFGADASLIAGTGVNTIERDARRRGQPMAELSARLGAERSIQQLDRQRELDAVNLAKTKADTRKSEVAATASEADAKREAALADPASPESNALRATASELLKDRISPKTLATMSGVQLREALKYGTSMVNAESMAQFRGEQLAQQDRNAALARQVQMEALAQGWDIFNATAEQREWMFNREAEIRKELAEIAAQKEAAKHERDRGEKLAEREVGGFKFAPGRTPSLEGSKIMAGAAKEIGRIRRSLTNLRELYAIHGTELFGTKAGLMESEFMNITNAARVMNDMGVPNGRDYEMLAKEIQDPTTLKDLFTSKGRNLAKMDLMRRRADELANDTAKIYGYEPETTPSAPPRVGTPENPSRGPSTFEPMGSAPAGGGATQKPRPSPAKAQPKNANGKTVRLYFVQGGIREVDSERAKEMAAANPNNFSLTPFPPEKIRRRMYSKKEDATYILDGNKNVISIEKGDTRVNKK